MKMVLVLVLVLVIASSGCSTGPYTPLKSGNLSGEKLVYFEQSDRMPKDVLLLANKDRGQTANAMMVFSPEVIAKVVEGLLKVAPELAKTYSEERMNNALMQRRMLFKGYSGAELKEVERIIRAMSGSIEFVTPRPASAAEPRR